MIIELLSKKFEEKRPKIAFVIVTKRIDDRFAMARQPLVNPPPGFLVYESVVKADWVNFFMVA